jgi:hypothetical protein
MTIRPSVDGTRLPIANMLLFMHRKDGVNLHRLLTGRGSRRLETVNLFSEEEDKRILCPAKERGLKFDDLARKLALAVTETLPGSTNGLIAVDLKPVF